MAKDTPKTAPEKDEPTTKDKAIEANEAHRQTVYMAARRAVEKTLGGLETKFNNSKAVFAGLTQSLFRSLNQEDLAWKEEIKGFDSKDYARLFNSELTESTKPFQERMERMSKIMVGYLLSMAKGAERGNLNPEELSETSASLAKNANNIKTLLELPDNEDLMAAFEWVTGRAVKDPQKESPSLDAYREKAVATIKKELNDTSTFDINDDRMSVVWMIIAFMNKKDQMDVLSEFSKNLSGEKQKEFVEMANLAGIIGPEGVATLMGKDLEDLTDAEKAMYGQRYEMQNVFTEQAKLLIEQTYGSKNDAMEMLSGKNVLLFLAKLWAGVTIGANLAVNLYTDQNYKRPLDYLMNIPKNVTGVLIPLGVALGADHIGKGDQTLGTFFEGKEDRDSQAAAHSKEVLKTKMTKNPGWKDFLTEGDYFGSKTLFSYVASKADTGKIDLKDLNIENFLEWIEEKEEGASDEKKRPYTDLKGRMIKEDGEGEKDVYKIGGIKVDTKEFQAMAAAIFTLKAGGQDAKKVIPKIMKEIEEK